MSIGFKEWALVCEAIGRGEQTVIVRKGGIAEGRDGFRFKHEEFFLFPTLFHEQLEKTTLPPDTTFPAGEPDLVTIRQFVRVEWTLLVTSLEQARALAPFHILRDEVVADRFHYDEPQGVNIAFLRAYRLEQPWIFPLLPAYGGCRSWLNLPNPPANLVLKPVLDDATYQARCREAQELLARATATGPGAPRESPRGT